MRALLLEQRSGETVAKISTVDNTALPQHDVTVDIHWSSLNYKDALAITGKGKIIRQFPMVPGIDFAGVVAESQDPRFKRGQKVLLTGWSVGENHWGGLAEQACVSGDWLVPLPANLDLRSSMIIGTAGFTAMLCVMALEEGGIRPGEGEILVTGASGGVGSTAVSLLSTLGYQVVALTGRETNHDYLYALGAKRIINRELFSEPTRPLEKQLWRGAVDTVGGQLLANVLSQMHYNSTVAACGLAGNSTLPATVLPFILRNVRLQGVDSVMTPLERRTLAWERLANTLPAEYYQLATHEITLEAVVDSAADLLSNRITGRTLVKIR